MIISINEGAEFEAIHKQLGFQFCSNCAFKRVPISSINSPLSLSCMSVRVYQLSHSWTNFREN